MPDIVTTAFAPLAALGGGVLIGLSAVLTMAAFGRIAGIAGITTGVLGAVLPMQGAAQDRGWRAAFLAGLIAAPLLVLALGGTVAQSVPASPVRMALAGLLVGAGTALGSGCTSGHGVCGLARFSRRSAVAVACFMAAAFATVFVMRHVLEVA